MKGLRRNNIQMNEGDYYAYYMPAVANVFNFEYSLSNGAENTQKSKAFDLLLGVRISDPYLSRRHSEDKPLPDDWREFLIKLRGPYAKTLIKVYQIKYGVNYEHSD